MENKDFDKFIKSSLERIETPYDATQWQKMEEDLDKEEGYIAHDPIDDIARRNLRNVDSEYRPEYWDQMSQRLDEEYSIVHKIYKYKIIEAGLFLLVLFTLINFLPTYPRLFHFQLRPANHDQQEVPQVAPALLQENREHAAVELPAVPSTQGSASGWEKVTMPVAGKNIDNNKQALAAATVSSAHSATNNSHSVTAEEGLMQPANTNDAIAKSASNTTEEGVAAETDVFTAVEAASTVIALSTANELETASTSVSREIAPVNYLETKAPAISFAVADDYAPKLSMVNPTVTRKAFRMGIVTALDIDHVTIPYSAPYENEVPYEQWSAGYSSGVTAGLTNKSWELEAAALYSNKKYTSNKVIQTGDFYNGYYLDSLRNVELSLVKVPVSIRHNIFKAGRVKLFALVGAALNVAITGNYDRDIVPWGNIAPGGPTSLRSVTIERDGVLEGGKFNENFYASVDAGIGVEYAVSPGLSLYAQGTYQQHLGALGPNKDQINSLSVYVGAKHTL